MLEKIQSGEPLSFRQRILLTIKLSCPAILAQLSSIIMQYIDAAMVGRLGADDSAAVGLMSTSLWLFWGICSAATTGFSVQIAHQIGASDPFTARKIFRQGIIMSVLFGLVVASIGLALATRLPHWLGGEGDICNKATVYFSVFVGALPLLTLNYLGSGALRAAGNMSVASGLNVMMCLLDVLFNLLLIFPSREISFIGLNVILPGADLGVLGAALGTVGAEVITAGLILWYATCKQSELAFKGEKGSFKPTGQIMRNALRIATPMTMEHGVICGAQIMITVIVAPLGVLAIAANSFAVTAEALCYMPGYGIADAATTLTGQSYGAKRKDLARDFGYLTVGLGMFAMSIMGIVLWIGAPYVMELLTPIKNIQLLGISALRIEAWAEPMFAASIVAYGVMVGVGDTIWPAIMNFSSIWLVRVPLAALMVGSLGLDGVWLAMCIELCFRGMIFLWRLMSGAWLRNGLNNRSTNYNQEELDTERAEEFPPSY